MRLLVSRRATRRLREIADYIHDRSPTAARHVQKGIREAFDLIAEYPDAGRKLDAGVRRFVVPRLPYVIYYRINQDPDAIVIITLRHAAQQEPR